MIFSVPELIARISRAITLEPGDVHRDRHAARRRLRSASRAGPPRTATRSIVRIARVGELRNPVRVP